MNGYTNEFKSKIVARMLPPNNISISDLAKETGISRETLYAWRSKYGAGIPVRNDTKNKGNDGFTSTQKFQHVLESATLNEHEIGEFCRRRGIFPEQLAAWRTACLVANEIHPRREDRTEQRELSKQIKLLEEDLRRKEKALAEAAALLILQKKVHALWGEDGDANLKCRREVR